MTPAGTVPSAPRRRLEARVSETELLFCRSRNGDRAARERLTLRFLPLARKLARRYSHSSLSSEDLLQVASVALLKAIDRFDPSRGTTFQAFAIPTILGELRRHFRDAAWALHVTRSAQERALSVQAAIGQLSARHGRSPTVREIAVYLELAEEDILDGLRASRAYATTSLDAPTRAEDEEDAATLGSEMGDEDTGYEQVERRILLDGAVGALSEYEQRILHMRFAAGMSQSQIGERLGISQMQVSRLLRRTLESLRMRLGGAFDS